MKKHPALAGLGKQFEREESKAMKIVRKDPKLPSQLELSHFQVDCNELEWITKEKFMLKIIKQMREDLANSY